MMNAFLQACGVPSALELEVEALGRARSVRYCLPQPFAIVGRHPAADIYLNSDGVRPRHVYFQAIEGRIGCINISQTGSFVADDAEVDSFCWLPVNRTIQIGSRKIKLLQEQREVETKPPSVKNPLAPGSAWDIFGPRITLEITNDETPGTKKTWLVDRLLTLIGRTSRCAIRFNVESISNVHCSLVLTDNGLWVVDLLGRGGVIINEQQVRVGLLGADDELRLGPFRIRPQEMPEPIMSLDDEINDWSLPPTDDFEIGEISQPKANRQARTYHTPWPVDVQQANLIEEMMDQFQDMKEPLFDQHQDVLNRVIETVEQLQVDQQQGAQLGMERLRDISEEVESIQQERQPNTPGPMIALPDPPSMPPVIHKTDAQSPASDPPSQPFRSASSLLKDPESSVFRIPTKKGDLFESAGGKE